jgi:hypothetical protein
MFWKANWVLVGELVRTIIGMIFISIILISVIMVQIEGLLPYWLVKTPSIGKLFLNYWPFDRLRMTIIFFVMVSLSNPDTIEVRNSNN